MAVKKRRIDMGAAVSAIRGQVTDLTASLFQLNDSLEQLAVQIGRFGSLTKEVTGTGQPYVPREALPPPQLKLSQEELNQRAKLLDQFSQKAKMRQEIEAEMDNGVAQ